MINFTRKTTTAEKSLSVLRTIVSLFVVLTCSFSAYAQPANDNPCNATPLTVGATCVFTNGTNIAATASAATVPAPGCGNYRNSDVWFSVTVPAGGSVSFEGNAGTMTDGALAVYSGNCNNLTLISCDDNSGAVNMPSLTVTGQPAGSTLWVRFWGPGQNNNTGTFQICATTPPSYDDPCTAASLPVSTTGCSYTTFTTANATNTTNVPAPGCGSYAGNDVWMTVTVPASGAVQLNSNTGTITDGAMAVYSGTNCSNLTLLACDDDASTNGLMPALNISNRPPGSTLYIRFWAFGNTVSGTFNLCATAFTPLAPTNQDCPNAIPICQNVYSTSLSYSGTGNILNEITPAISCLTSGERNDVWYTFTVQQSGNLNFTITPNQFTDDYDWAVYNLTNATCADIATNPALSVSCNFSATGGNTGPTGGSNQNSQNALGTPFNQVIPVTAGQTYVINVSNFSSTQFGYTINFGASTATIFDNIPPQMTALASPASCGATQLTFEFSENILCSTIQNADFTLTGPGGPYTLSNWTSVGCNNGGTFGNSVTVNVSPPIRASGSFSFCLTNSSQSVTDLCGNIAPPSCFNFTINPILVTAASTNPACNGTPTGTMSVSPTSGLDPYTYAWTPNVGSTSTINNAYAGNYNVTITDANGCTATQSITLTDPPPMNVSASYTLPACGGANLTVAGSASATGGTAPYTFAWTSSTGTPVSVLTLTPGTYTITATDARGCTGTASLTIALPVPVTAAINSSTSPACFGTNTGSASVVGTGGSGIFTYSWSPSGGNGSTANNLGAGTYTVTVTDNRGCTSLATVTLTAPTRVIPVIASTNNVSCNGGNNGAINVTTSGGSPGYIYSWSPAAGNSSTASNLIAGTYTVTVTDLAGCTGTVTTTITQPNAISAPVANTSVTCNGLSNGTATVNATGGTSPYTYSWLPTGGNGTTATGLSANLYSVTVTDQNGCTTVSTVTIAQPTPITYTSSSTTATCGSSDGSASVVISGGIGPYTYSWSPSGATSASASNLAGGAYTVTVTDSRGCTTVAAVTVPNQNAATASITNFANASCNGAADGSATVVASGSPGPFSYTWSPSGGNGATATGLSAGTYVVTITDPAGCNAAANITITEPAAVTAAISSSSNVTCSNLANGSATALGGGGTPGYTYSWSPSGGTGVTASNLAAGNYTVTITDQRGCTQQAVATITAPLPITANITPTQMLCNGDNNASAVVAAGGGTAPFTYAWNPTGGTGASASNLSPGTYTVTVTDDLGCTQSATTSISNPALLQISSTPTNILCAGAGNGAVNLTAGGGTGALAYTWSPAISTGSSANNLSPGTYTATVTDANGCTASVATTITEAPPLTLALNSTTDVLCAGGTTGSASVTAGGGTGNLTYSWTPSGGSTATAGNLAAGTYTVLVTDANNCTITTSATISEPPVLNATATIGATLLCAGANSGSATVSAGGGSSPYQYSWSNGAVSTSINNLTAGNYTVTVTDANTCTVTSSVTLVAPPPIQLNTIPANAQCGLSNGEIEVVASGGTGAFTYTWSPNVSNFSIAAGLAAGSYSVVVSDANGCTQSTSASITNTQPIIATTTATANVSCNGLANGSAGVTITSGNGGYTYSWSPSGGSGQNATNLAAGSYTVVVTDAAGCTVQNTVNITEPTLLSAVTNSSNVSCNGVPNGSGTISASGGNPAYSFSWNPGAFTDSSVTTLSAGNYTITVTDANGCTTAANITISQPPLLTISGTPSPVSCAGVANGSISTTANGGTPGYTYSWSNGAGNSTNINNLPGGTYTVTVTDINGCTATAQSVINEPAPLTLTAATTANVSCFGAADGGANTSVIGGTSGYTYAWTPSVSTSATAGGLAAGTYSVTVTDVNGCTAAAAATITEPPLLTLTSSAPVNVLCNGGNTGSASVNASGGSPLYSYSWSPSGGNTFSAGSLIAGNYTVTVTDAYGCTALSAIQITEPPLLTSVVQTTSDVLCNGGNTGAITVVAGGGTSGYNYSWTPSGGSNSIANNLVAGTYSVTITDANGCSTTVSATINQPPLLTASLSATPSLCGIANGAINSTIAGGAGNYSFVWNPAAGNTNSISGLAGGNYTLTVTDGNGCTATANTAVPAIPGPLAVASTLQEVSCFGGNNGSANVSISSGTAPFNITWSPSGGNSTTASNLAAGSYTVIITDNNGCTSTSSTTVVQPLILTTTTSAAAATCNGSSDGTVIATPTGGTAPYTYNWNPGGANSAQVINLLANTYQVTITDANGCTVTQSATVNQPSALALTTTSTPAACNGSSDGTASATVTGGTPGYTYAWFPSSNTSPVSTGLAAGTYSVTITDLNGCQTNSAVVVTEPTAVSVFTNTTAAICGNSNGSATATVSGGTGPYTYLWTPGNSTTAAANGLAAGGYSVLITDDNGCTASASASVSNTGGPIAAASVVNNVSCTGGNDGSATVAVSSGTQPFTYSWSPSGGSANTANGLSAGNYSVNIIDANGCVTTDNVTVSQPVALLVNTVNNSTLCNGSLDGTVSATATGGIGPYNYSWSPGNLSGATATGLAAGTYTVTATDANGCTLTATTIVSSPAAINLNATSTNLSCNGGSDGSISVTASGGSGNFSYNWFPAGGNGNSANNLPAGNYTVTVTDINGCTANQAITLTSPSAINLSTGSTPATCGTSNGSATVSAIGGAVGYNYAWTNSTATTATANNLSGGAYTVTVTDQNGCTATAIATVSNIGGPTIAATVAGNVSCNSGSNGSATVSVTSGSAPYFYSWSPSGGTGATATGLSAGNYSVTVTDVNGCISSDNVTIAEPASLIIQASASPVSCVGGSDGSASVISTGGTSPYSYSWTGGGGSGSTASNLLAGNYTVTVTDAAGCTTTAGASVSQPSALSVQATSTATTCNGAANGSATASVSGGTSGYTYSWFPTGGNNSTAIGLAAASYTVTITDANGCTATRSVQVLQPAAISLNTTSTPAACGQSNGSASVTATGGSGGFSYSWAPGGASTATASSLPAGPYTITVTDAAGCTTTASATISNTGGPTISANVVSNVSCFGGNNGGAAVTITSGNGPYSYTWSPTGGNGATAQNLPAGTYSVSITDVNGCIAADNVIISEPTALIAQANSTATSCYNGNDGSVNVNALGGTSPFNYVWTPGNISGNQASNLSSGNYSVTVTDNNGCTVIASTSVSQPVQINVSTTPSAASCNGINDGMIMASASGGSAGYSYLWFPAGGNSAAATGLAAGSYTVTVTDANGCTGSQQAVITQPSAIQLQTTTTPASCGASNGSASVTPTGGVSPFAYLWSPAGGFGSIANSIGAGAYSVTVTDNNGCTSAANVVVGTIGGASLSLTNVDDVSCAGAADGAATVSATGGTGPLTFSWSSGGSNNSSATGLSGGNYTVTVTDANGCPSFINVIIQEPDPILLQTTSTPSACGVANGSASVLAAGGSPGYTFSWSPGNNTTATASSLLGGSYVVTVTDAAGCTQTASTTVTSIGGANLLLQQVNDVSCAGGADGSATISATGGTSPYTYLWSTGSTTTNATGLTADVYDVTVTDANGCASNILVPILEPSPISISTSTTPAACNGGTDGTATATVNGGAAPYQYAWSSSGSTTATANGLSQGIYTITITDANGCAETSTAQVNSNSTIQASLSSTAVNCYGGNNGTASVSTVGGTPPYTYSWSPGGNTTTSLSGLSTGTYEVTVTDITGCSQTQFVQVSQPAMLTLSSTGAATLCNAQSANLAAQAAGGTPPYAYTWSTGAAGSSITVTPNQSTVYNVDVTDANGCTTLGQTLSVVVLPPLQVVATGSDTVCLGNSVTLQATATGGDGNYNFSWNNGAAAGSSVSVTPTADSIFTVTLLDGCGQPVTDQVNIIVRPGPVVDFTPQLISGCTPVIVNFNDLSVAPNGSNYFWNFGDQQTSTLNSPSHTYTQPGTYDVSLTVSSGNGCADTYTVPQLVNVYPYPIAGFTPSSTELSLLDPLVTFANSSSGAVGYQWNFGDGSPLDFTADPIHQYEDTGTYTVILQVTNTAGCIDTISVQIRIEESFAIYIPNAFTPNGDGVNDGFIAFGIGIVKYDMFIIDRWGLPIFHSTKMDEPWNGTVHNKDEICQNDVYEYVIRATDTKGQVRRYVGHVTLVR